MPLTTPPWRASRSTSTTRPAPHLLDFASSASDGTYTIDGVDPGSYLVYFNPAVTYSTEWYDDAPDLSSADAVSVAASQETPDIDAVSRKRRPAVDPVHQHHRYRDDGRSTRPAALMPTAPWSS